MGRLFEIAQRHIDAYGVTEATLAKRMGTSPQTLNSWKNRGVRRMPTPALLLALARETRTPYEDVLVAALSDAGYVALAAKSEISEAELLGKLLKRRLASDDVSPPLAMARDAEVARSWLGEAAAPGGAAEPTEAELEEFRAWRRERGGLRGAPGGNVRAHEER